MICERVTNAAYPVSLKNGLTFEVLDDNKRFLAAVRCNDKTSLLYTVGTKNKSPYCGTCKAQRCECFRFLRHEMEKEARDQDTEHFWDR